MTLYVGLYRQEPSTWTAEGEHVQPPPKEVSGGDYARQVVTFDYLPQGNQLTVANSNRVIFPMATSDWGYVNLIHVYQDDFLVIAIPLNTALRIGPHTAASFHAGSILITVDTDSETAQVIQQSMMEHPVSWNDLSEFADSLFHNRGIPLWQRALSDDL